MNLESIIISLLYQYDCVIVPGFGGFIAKNTPAEFNPIDYTMAPPKKKISFNSDLTHSDGLLANAVSKKMNMEYKAAMVYISREVAHWESIIEKEHTLNLSGLGVVRKQNQILSFTPAENINFSLDTYGLQPIKASYILREKQAKKAQMSKSAWGTYVAAIALAIGVGSTSFLANTQIVQPQLSSILPLAIAEPEYIGTNTTPIAPFIEAQISKKQKPMQADVPEEEIKIQTTEKENTSTIKPYQVIGGSYKVYHRAMQAESEFKRKGFKEAIIIGKVGSYFMVAYQTFDTEQEALDLKHKLEAEGKDVFLRGN